MKAVRQADRQTVGATKKGSKARQPVQPQKHSVRAEPQSDESFVCRFLSDTHIYVHAQIYVLPA